MRYLLSLIAVLAGVTARSLSAAESAALTAGDYEFVFATVEQGREVLGKRDTFVSQMSPFDRKVRMGTEKDAGEKAYLEFAAQEVIPWTPSGREAITAAIESLDKQLKPIQLPPLDQMLLIHTSGKEEGGAPYTRGNAIILPSGKTGSKDRPQLKMLAHELFHVISRNHPEMRNQLYARIGFRHVGKVRFPNDLAERKITNPDAPLIEHVITMKVNGESDAVVTPVTFARRDYDHTSKSSLFDYLDFQLMEAMIIPSKPTTLKVVDGKPVMHSPMSPDYLRQVGRNTRYIIHPEEILADNFSIMVTGTDRVNDQWVIDAVREVLASDTRDKVSK